MPIFFKEKLPMILEVRGGKSSMNIPIFSTLKVHIASPVRPWSVC
jgi:hypothetical protein